MKRTAAICLVMLFVVASCLLLRRPVAQDREAISSGSTASHWAGTDELGRDRAQRTAGAFVLGLVGAVVAGAAATCITSAVAFSAVFCGSRVRATVLYVSDLCITLPWLFLLMLVRTVLPLNMPALASAAVSFGLLAALGWPVYVRSVTARVDALQKADWLLQARSSGLGTIRLLRMHVLPHARPVLMTQFLLCVPLFLIAEANLGSLGLGVSEPLVSWGSLLGELTTTSQRAATAWVYLPLVVLVVTMLCMETLGAEE